MKPTNRSEKQEAVIQCGQAEKIHKEISGSSAPKASFGTQTGRGFQYEWKARGKQKSHRGAALTLTHRCLDARLPCKAA